MLGNARHYCTYRLLYLAHAFFFFFSLDASVLEFLIAFWSWMSSCPFFLCQTTIAHVQVRKADENVAWVFCGVLCGVFFLLSLVVFSPQKLNCARGLMLWKRGVILLHSCYSLLILTILCAVIFVVTLLCYSLGYFLMLLMFKKGNEIITCNRNPSFCM